MTGCDPPTLALGAGLTTSRCKNPACYKVRGEEFRYYRTVQMASEGGLSFVEGALLQQWELRALLEYVATVGIDVIVDLQQ